MNILKVKRKEMKKKKNWGTDRSALLRKKKYRGDILIKNRSGFKPSSLFINLKIQEFLAEGGKITQLPPQSCLHCNLFDNSNYKSLLYEPARQKIHY